MIPLLHSQDMRYKLSKFQENINHLVHIEEIKLCIKNEKELETNAGSGNIESGLNLT